MGNFWLIIYASLLSLGNRGCKLVALRSDIGFKSEFICKNAKFIKSSKSLKDGERCQHGVHGASGGPAEM